MDNTEYTDSWMADEEPHHLAEADAAARKKRDELRDAERQAYQRGFDEEPGSETAAAENDPTNGTADD